MSEIYEEIKKLMKPEDIDWNDYNTDLYVRANEISDKFIKDHGWEDSSRVKKFRANDDGKAWYCISMAHYDKYFAAPYKSIYKTFKYEKTMNDARKECPLSKLDELKIEDSCFPSDIKQILLDYNFKTVGELTTTSGDYLRVYLGYKLFKECENICIHRYGFLFPLGNITVVAQDGFEYNITGKTDKLEIVKLEDESYRIDFDIWHLGTYKTYASATEALRYLEQALNDYCLKFTMPEK